MSTDIERTLPANAATGPLINLYIAPDEETRDSFVASFLHSCGYTRAWLAFSQPLFVWYLSECPADAAIAEVQAQLPVFVTGAYEQTPDIPDPVDRAEAVVNLVNGNITSWIDTQFYTHLAAFLQNHPDLRRWIEYEMVNQLIVAWN